MGIVTGLYTPLHCFIIRLKVNRHSFLSAQNKNVVHIYLQLKIEQKIVLFVRKYFAITCVIFGFMLISFYQLQNNIF